MLAITAAICLILATDIEPTNSQATVIVVVGEAGEQKYESQFTQWSDSWENAAETAKCHFVRIGPPQDLPENQQDRDVLRKKLQELVEQPPSELWLVLIGHGTFDGKKAKFNLRGKDIAADELGQWLKPISSRTAIINSASASGPFVNSLSGANRVVITATQSGFEYNFARIGGFLAEAIQDERSDLDKDGQTSLLEAWLAAAYRTKEHYESESQLVTEHTLLDDNADGKGTPADWFRGIHVKKNAQENAIPDGTLANQMLLVPAESAQPVPTELVSKRDELELELANLRLKKKGLTEEEYLNLLEPILLKLARIYHSAD